MPESSNATIHFYTNTKKKGTLMLFMTYKPKAAKNVRAERVTAENINEIAAIFAGTARVARDAELNVAYLKIATLDGPLEARVGQWVVRHEDGVEVMDDRAFAEKYERARVTREG